MQGNFRMKVDINNDAYFLDKPANLTDLLMQLSLPSLGMAVAINGDVIKRKHWNEQFIQDGDKLSIFKVIAGG